MYFTSGSDRAFEQLMQTRPGADHFDNGEAGAPEDCGTCRFYRPHWKYQFCVYEECPYQPGKLTALDGAVKFQVKGVDDEMAVFRVEKNRGYTVMSNHHLRNKDLSLKAKGLLSQMLSLPESWDFTLKGLSLINREQIDAIRAAVRELEQAGYIVRSRERDSQGRLRGADYIIYEQPQPVPDSPTLENPTLDNPTQEKPTQEKPTQLNKDRSSKEKSITDGSNTDSILILSPPSPLGEEAAAPPERKGTGAKSQSAVEIYRDCSLRGRGGCLGGRTCRHILRRGRAGRQCQRQQTGGQPCGVFHRGYPPLFVVPPAYRRIVSCWLQLCHGRVTFYSFSSIYPICRTLCRRSPRFSLRRRRAMWVSSVRVSQPVPSSPQTVSYR